MHKNGLTDLAEQFASVCCQGHLAYIACRHAVQIILAAEHHGPSHFETTEHS